MTDEEVRELLLARCREAGTIKRFAYQYHLQRTYVSAVIHGHEKIPASICVALGLVRKVIYEPLPQKETAPCGAAKRPAAGATEVK